LHIEHQNNFRADRRGRLYLTNILSASMDLDFPFLDVDAIADAADIPESVNFIDDHQLDIPENELSLTCFTSTVFSPKLPRRGKIDIRPREHWNTLSLLVFLNNLSGKRICPNGHRRDLRTGTYICYTFCGIGPSGRHRIRIKILEDWSEVHVRIARAWLPQSTRRVQTEEQLEREKRKSTSWICLKNGF
jgi:hypothetical protein